LTYISISVHGIFVIKRNNLSRQYIEIRLIWESRAIHIRYGNSDAIKLRLSRLHRLARSKYLVRILVASTFINIA
jgi:hypothetical protein